MKKAIRTYNTLLAIMLTLAVNGQVAERIGLHYDRNKYIAGEDIWFSIYNTDSEKGTLTSVSSVAYVELINPWNSAVIQERIKLTGGRGNGNFLIPDSVSSGTYLIRAYTNSMKDLLPLNCHMNYIEIYNPFRESFYKGPDLQTEDPRIKLRNKLRNSLLLHEITTDSLYRTRGEVFVKIRTADMFPGGQKISEMSVSVAPYYAADTCFEFSDTYTPGNVPALHDNEKAGHFLNFRVTSEDGKIPDRPPRLFLSVSGKVADFIYAEPDSSGFYTFLLPVDNKQRTLMVQPGGNEKNLRIEAVSSFPEMTPGPVTYLDTLTQQQDSAFSRLSFNYQASKIYGITGKKEVESGEQEGQLIRRFYGKPEMEVRLDDYIKLPDMTEVFFELLPGINLRPGKNGYELKITNPLTGVFYEEPPFVMVDGVVINDLSQIVELNPDLVEKIEVVITPYLVGDIILHGIVNVITRAGDLRDISIPGNVAVLPYRAVDKGFEFTSPSYSDEQSRLSRKPDLRNTLYWNPSVRTDSEGEARFSFHTSDLPGNYIISLCGVTSTGEKMKVSKSFMVK